MAETDRREAVAVVDRRARPDCRPRFRRIAGSVVRYVVLLAVAAVIVIPVAYAALGGFRDAPQLAADPVGLPDPWVWTNYTDSLLSASFWIQLRNSAVVAGLTTIIVVLFGGARGVRPRPARVPGSRGRVHGVHAGPAVPGDGRDPAAAHPGPRPRAARQPARPGPAGGGVRAAADDHHPAAVLPEHPDGARGRGRDRRLRVARASSSGSCCRWRGRPWSPSRCSPSCRAGTSSCCRW